MTGHIAKPDVPIYDGPDKAFADHPAVETRTVTTADALVELLNSSYQGVIRQCPNACLCP
jgi:hypothetical protein